MEILNRLSEGFWHQRGYSAVDYVHLLNLRPQDGVPRCFINEGKTHIGPDRFAMDIIIPDPERNRLPIYAPAGGVVKRVVDKYDMATTDIRNSWMVNTIRIFVTPHEYYEIKHFKTGSCKIIEEQHVDKGQLIAETGTSGFYIDTKSHHVHFAVHGIKFTNKVTTFPLRTRFVDYNILYGADGSVLFEKK